MAFTVGATLDGTTARIRLKHPNVAGDEVRVLRARGARRWPGAQVRRARTDLADGPPAILAVGHVDTDRRGGGVRCGSTLAGLAGCPESLEGSPTRRRSQHSTANGPPVRQASSSGDAFKAPGSCEAGLRPSSGSRGPEWVAAVVPRCCCLLSVRTLRFSRPEADGLEATRPVVNLGNARLASLQEQGTLL